MILKYIASQEGGGMDKLKGKKIGYLYLDAGYGKEPLPFPDQLSKDYGFETKFYPIAAAEMQNQSAQWLNVRRDKPDYVIMYGWARCNRRRSRKPSRSAIRWRSSSRSGGRARRTRKAGGEGRRLQDAELARREPGFPGHQATSRSTSSTRAKSLAAKDKVGSVLQPRRLQFDADRRRHPHRAEVTGKGRYRRGRPSRSESLNIDAARLKEMGMEGFAGPVKLTCQDHNGHQPTFVQRFDGTKFVKVSRT